jgi:alginate export protein
MMRIAMAGVLLALLFAGFVRAASGAEDTTSLTEAISSGKLIFNLRPRYEQVDQANFAEDAEALTMRSLLGWETGSWYGLSAKAEWINVSRGISDYNDTLNGKTQYPVIADPDDNDINQLYIDYRGLPATLLRGGRQAIKLDKMRFVGNVAFRQVMQVFDGVIAENKSLSKTNLYAGYLARVKTVTTRDFDTNTILLNGRYSITPGDALVAYGYFQDQVNAINPGAFLGPPPADTSNQIVGIRGAGAHPLNDAWKLLYTAEYASQADYKSGDPRIDADYLRLGGGAQWRGYLLRLDYENLGSNDGQYAFQTPLGTNHLYQGWADVFLTTPRQGIKDTYLTGSAKIAKLTLKAEYHDFEADFGGLDFGSEFDIGLSYPFLKQLTGKIEYADYSAGDTGTGKVDVTKFWLTLIFNY